MCKGLACTEQEQQACECPLSYRSGMRRSDEPGAWYAMLPLEMVYAFDPIPPEPEMMATPMSRSSMSDMQVLQPVWGLWGAGLSP